MYFYKKCNIRNARSLGAHVILIFTHGIDSKRRE